MPTASSSEQADAARPIRATDGRTRAVRMDAEDDDLRQAALVSRPQSHPIRLHGALTPNAKPRPSGAAYL
jgi:hypothetical protein